MVNIFRIKCTTAKLPKSKSIVSIGFLLRRWTLVHCNSNSSVLLAKQNHCFHTLLAVLDFNVLVLLLELFL